MTNKEAAIFHYTFHFAMALHLESVTDHRRKRWVPRPYFWRVNGFGSAENPLHKLGLDDEAQYIPYYSSTVISLLASSREL